MNKMEMVRKAISFDTPPEEAREYLRDDFQFVDSVGGPPLNKEAWFGMGQLMKASMPDIDFVTEEIHQEGEDVILTGHITGTFKHNLDLSAMNMGVIPATGKKIVFPGSTSRISFAGDKISKNQDLDTGPNAGLGGFLAALRAG